MQKFLVVFLPLLLWSCSKQSSSSFLENEKFEAIYVELLDSTVVGQTASGDSTLSPIAERILRRHSVTPEQFRATVQDYNKDAKRWKEFYENIVNRIAKRDTAHVRRE